MREWFYRIFEGKRGPDVLSGVLFGMGLVLSAVAWFTHNQLLAWLVYLPWLVAVWRMFSTRLEKRYEENRRFLECWHRVKEKVGGWFSGQKSNKTGSSAHKKTAFGGPSPKLKVQDADEYHHFSCPTCGQKLRVPYGRGTLLVTCPKCQKEFQVTT